MDRLGETVNLGNGLNATCIMKIDNVPQSDALARILDIFLEIAELPLEFVDDILYQFAIKH